MNLDNMPCRNSTQCASGQTFYHRKLHLCDKNFLYKKLGRRRNVAPCKNCNQFFDVAPIMCDFSLKVNPCAKFSRVFKRIIFTCTMTHVLLFLQTHKLKLHTKSILDNHHSLELCVHAAPYSDYTPFVHQSISVLNHP